MVRTDSTPYLLQSLLLILRNRRYLAPAWVFASLNIVTGTWVIYIPAVKEKLGIDDGQVGLALFAFSMGLLAIIPFSASITSKIGLGKATVVGISAFSLAMILPMVAATYVALCGALFLAGAMASLTDISMNALVSELEKEDDIHFMSAAHGFFSLGGVLGAGIGSLILPFFEVPAQHLMLVAIIVMATNALLAGAYWGQRSTEAEREEGGIKWQLIRPLFGLVLLAMLVMGSEGAIEHWSKLYLLEVVEVSSEQLAGFGFVAFSATMTLGRFLGDGISDRFGPYTLIVGGTGLAAVGFLSVLTATLWPAMFGFALIGLGFSVVIPEVFRLAGRAKNVSSAEGIAVVAGLGYVGFLASPALLGFLSDWSSLRLSFAALLVAALIAAFTGWQLGRQK